MSNDIDIDIEELAKEHCHHQMDKDTYAITEYGITTICEAYHKAKCECEASSLKQVISEQEITIERLKAKVSRLKDCANEYDDLIRHLDAGNDHTSFFARFNKE